MSVEADFALSGWVFQASGSQVSWDISWPSMIDGTRFAAVSFQGDFGSTQLTRVSEWFSNPGGDDVHIGELIRAHSGLPGGGVAFQFSVVVIPGH
jgi:hypothetical protein